MFSVHTIQNFINVAPKKLQFLYSKSSKAASINKSKLVMRSGFHKNADDLGLIFIFNFHALKSHCFWTSVHQWQNFYTTSTTCAANHQLYPMNSGLSRKYVVLYGREQKFQMKWMLQFHSRHIRQICRRRPFSP